MQALLRIWLSLSAPVADSPLWAGCVHDAACGIGMGVVLMLSVDCGDNAETADMLRRLPTTRYERLFADIEALDRSRDGPSLRFNKWSGIPDAFADLSPNSMVIRGSSSMVYMSGCMDNKVVLFLDGVNQPGEVNAVRLLPGELMPTEVLWSNPGPKGDGGSRAKGDGGG